MSDVIEGVLFAVMLIVVGLAAFVALRYYDRLPKP